MKVGTQVRRKRDGRLGQIIAETDTEIIVRFPATGETMESPWGKYKDAGQEGHIRKEYIDRMIEVVSA